MSFKTSQNKCKIEISSCNFLSVHEKLIKLSKVVSQNIKTKSNLN